MFDSYSQELKTSITLIYSSIIGFLASFFSYFGVYETQTTLNHYTYETTTTTKTVIQACVDGTIQGGGFAFFLSMIILVVSLITDIMLTSKLYKREDPTKTTFLFAIVAGGLMLINAIIQIAIFSKAGAQPYSSHASSKEAAIIDNTSFVVMYLGSFEAAGTSIVGGIIGYKNTW